MKRRTLQIMGGNGWGGGAYLACEVALELVKQGWEVDFLSSHPTANARFANLPGCRVIDSIDLPREVKPVTDLKALGQIIRLIRSAKYDVVETYNSTPSVVGRIAARLAGAKIIFHHQAGWNTSYAGRLSRPIFWCAEQVAVRASTLSLCCGVAEFEEGVRLKMPRSKLRVIRNGIDLRRFNDPSLSVRADAIRARWNLPENSVVFGTAGRLSPVKNVPMMIEAFRIHAAVREGTYLMIAGEGELGDELLKQANSAGAGNRLRMLGHLDDVPAYLRALDGFVTSTNREGLSISIIEAMASGLSILATDIPPNRELIDTGVNGLLSPVGDPESFASALTCLSNDPTGRQRQGKLNREIAEAEFDIRTFVAKTVSAYEEFL